MEDEDTSYIRSLKRVREAMNARPISLVISKWELQKKWRIELFPETTVKVPVDDIWIAA
jgi:hypothetical protein